MGLCRFSYGFSCFFKFPKSCPVVVQWPLSGAAWLAGICHFYFTCILASIVKLHFGKEDEAWAMH